MAGNDAIQAERALRVHTAGPNVDWEFVKSMLHKLPVATEASSRPSLANDPMGRSLLISILTKDPPVQVVDACLRAFPDATEMNVSAYFMASRCRDTNVIRSLIRLGYQRRASDACPYSWLCMSHVSLNSAETIIREYPQGVLQQCNGSKYCLLDRALFSVRDCQHGQPDPSWWDKVVLMLKVAEHGVLEDDTRNKFHPIHTFVRRVVSRPEFFKNRNVAQHTVWSLHQLRLKYPFLFRVVNEENGDSALHVLLKARCKSGPGAAYAKDLISILVDSFGQSASLCNKEDGRLPLFIGLANGWPCHEVLVRVAPDSLRMRDPVTGLYPFQLAACVKPQRKRKRAGTVGDGKLDVVFSLLREDPLRLGN